MFSLIRALFAVTLPSVVTLPTELILPNELIAPVPDKAPSKNVLPLIPKLLPNWSAFVVVVPLSVTSCNVSDVATWLSTYALIDCWVAKATLLSLAILSSSLMEVISVPPAIESLSASKESTFVISLSPKFTLPDIVPPANGNFKSA